MPGYQVPGTCTWYVVPGCTRYKLELNGMCVLPRIFPTHHYYILFNPSKLKVPGTSTRYKYQVQVPDIVPVPYAVLAPGTSRVHLFLHLHAILQSIFNHATK